MTEKQRHGAGRAETGEAVARISGAAYRTEITLPEGHRVVADEPTFAGGANLGPAPIDLICASLAASKAITIRMQADRHGWPLTGANVNVHHRRVSAQRSLGESPRGMVDLIDCEIELLGDDLNDQHRRRLLFLSNDCWVQHALTHTTRVSTRMIEAT